MQIVNLIQGSPEWHAHRAKHFNASDAPAMLGISQYKTRSQLLKERATVITQDVDDATQRRFNDGHRFEALARPLAEKIIGEELSPVTGTRDEYSASFDGITFDMRVWTEHKSMNDELRSVLSVPGVTGTDLPEVYQVQMEHQADVCEGDKCLFMASKWDADGNLLEELHCWYTPNPELRARIRHGWIQFKKDLVAYSPAAEADKVTATAIMALPSLSVTIKGEVTNSNLPVFVSEADRFLAGIKTVLETDQDFADAESNVKACKAAEDGIEQTKKAITAQATSIDEVMRTMDLYKEKLSTVRLKLDKLVKSEKIARKDAIAMQARAKYAEHLAALESEIKPIRLAAIAPVFAESMSGLKKLSAMQDAVDTALRDGIYALDAMATDYRAKLAWCKNNAAGQSALFPDLQQIITKPLDDFTLLITSRIEAQKKAEAEKLEAQHAKMESEAKEKADREAASKIAEAEERIRTEERAKLIAEASKLPTLSTERVGEIMRELKTVAESEPASSMATSVSSNDAGAKDSIEMVTIPKSEYERLLSDSEWLGCLEAAGVDNWSGIDKAHNIRCENEVTA